MNAASAARTVPELFASVAAAYPDAPAVVHRDTALEYRLLDQQSNRLARQLTALGVGPDTLVALAVPRSTELVVAVLAVLKAGGAYLPLDPDYPRDRLAHMVSDARPMLLLRTSAVGLPDTGLPEVVLDSPDTARELSRRSPAGLGEDDLRSPLRPHHLMYVIYTSGSSGLPKGVAVTHEGVADLAVTQATRFGVAPGERVLQWASVSFDAAFWDIALALLSGATLVMADADDVLPGRPLRETLLKHDITHAVLPPVALSLTDSEGVLLGGTIMSTGDACTPALVRKWSPGRRMFNGYGPTEVTVGATIAGPIDDADRFGIGQPWTGGAVYVLDERLRPVPDGKEGELYLAGSGLARGYLNRPGLTAATFVPNPFGPPGSRMYRSGDRGRREKDGSFSFTGRADDQVKVRGFRIELGEVEACLGRHPAVDLAVAMVEGQLADARVVAYATVRPGATVTPRDLRSAAADALPEWMVPARVTVLDSLPTLPNGKIDRQALGRPGGTPTAPRRSLDADASAEEVLCAEVGALLGLPSVDPSDNLFEIGANSLVVARLVSAVDKELGVRLPLRAVFESASLAELAGVLRELMP
ncbi:non-ribosomal peptide synthetase [Streptomyces mirabilis]|uniref:non-ribosomal peptide synthetase n=1 Tax=Streptomyces mirabilis TaxID=68239 RepID=UPI0036DA686F